MGAAGGKGISCCDRGDDKTPRISPRSPCLTPPRTVESISDLLVRLETDATDVETVLRQRGRMGQGRSQASKVDPEMVMAEEVISRVMMRLRRLHSQQRRYTWHCEHGPNGAESQAATELEQERWETMYQGRRPSFTSLKELVCQVQTENRIVKHWQDQTLKTKWRKSSTKQLADHRDGTARIAEEVDSWTALDVFEVDRLTQRPLSRIFMSIWLERQFSDLCRVSNEQALEYVTALESQYKANPYHNRLHAADVTATSYYLVSRFAQVEGMEGYVRDVDILAMILAASCHDVGHPGVNNDFLNRTGHRLALRYNDRSTLENYHVATTFELMRELNIDMLAHNLPSPPSAALRSRIVDMVLATDMAYHKPLFEELVSELTENRGNMQNINKITLEKNLMHTSDIGHPLRPFKLHQLWSERVNEEFLSQGDQEKLQGLQPVALFDRNKAPPLPQGQIGFINFVVLPAWTPLIEVIGVAGEEPDKCLKENTVKWEELAKPSELDHSS